MRNTVGQAVRRARFRAEIERLIDAGLFTAAEVDEALTTLELHAVLERPNMRPQLMQPGPHPQVRL